mmetsp:Transcript_13278/g.55672  ORF Transcript_13278/g.55672 Transcript_13278/m.55672 type:complete len:209 (-) Transcript_13278:676-1302(-)
MGQRIARVVPRAHQHRGAQRRAGRALRRQGVRARRPLGASRRVGHQLRAGLQGGLAASQLQLVGAHRRRGPPPQEARLAAGQRAAYSAPSGERRRATRPLDAPKARQGQGCPEVQDVRLPVAHPAHGHAAAELAERAVLPAELSGRRQIRRPGYHGGRGGHGVHAGRRRRESFSRGRSAGGDRGGGRLACAGESAGNARAVHVPPVEA